MEFITDSIITGMFDNTHIKARLFLKFIVDKSAVIKLVINKTAYPKYEQYELSKSKVIISIFNRFITLIIVALHFLNLLQRIHFRLPIRN